MSLCCVVIVIAYEYKNAVYCNVLLRAKQVLVDKAVYYKIVFILFFFCCYVIPGACPRIGILFKIEKF